MRSHLVAVVDYEDLCRFEFACAVEIFSVRWPGIAVPWYNFGVCAASTSTWRPAAMCSCSPRNSATSCRISTGAGSSASTKASHRRERGLRSFALARQGAASDTLPAGRRTSFLWTAERCASQGAHAPRGAVILAHQTGEAILWVSGLGVELAEAGTRGTADHQSRRRRRSPHRWV